MIEAEIRVKGETLGDVGLAIDEAREKIVDGQYLAGTSSNDTGSYSFDVQEPEPVAEATA